MRLLCLFFISPQGVQDARAAGAVSAEARCKGCVWGSCCQACRGALQWLCVGAGKASQQSNHPLAATTAGFFSSYNNSALAPNITAEVKRLAALFPDLPLYIGGHSMGAAMAHMCALDLRYNANMSQVHVYTYGSPRVGNTQFYDFFNTSVEVRRPKLGWLPPPTRARLRTQEGRSLIRVRL